MLKEKNSNRKGQLLEQMIRSLVEHDSCLKVFDSNIDTKSEEIDIVLENKNVGTFFHQLQSPIILVECKNWSSKIGAKDIRDLAQRVQNRPRVMCKVGCVITTSELTKDAINELIGYRGRDLILCAIEGKDIEEIIKQSVEFSVMLERKIKAASLR